MTASWRNYCEQSQRPPSTFVSRTNREETRPDAVSPPFFATPNRAIRERLATPSYTTKWDMIQFPVT